MIDRASVMHEQQEIGRPRDAGLSPEQPVFGEESFAPRSPGGASAISSSPDDTPTAPR
jgi:hypothetical protein